MNNSQTQSSFRFERTSTCFRIIPQNAGVHELRILQLTDMHLSGPFIHNRELRSIARMAKYFRIDLIVITGDLFCHRDFMPLIRHLLRSIDGILGNVCPWTFAWGNHDNENFLSKGKTEWFNELEQYLANLPHSYYLPTRQFFDNYPNPPLEPNTEEYLAVRGAPEGKIPWKEFDGFYGGNFRFEVMNFLNQPQWNLFMLNSRRWAHIPPKVLDWMQELLSQQKPSLPSLLFYHVPNYEYHTQWELGKGHGIKREAVCYEHDHGRVHEFIKKLPNIRGVFVGHDHTNDYWFELDGIIYAYGRKTGMSAYGAEKTHPPEDTKEKRIRWGAKLIQIALNGINPAQNAMVFHSVFIDGTYDPKLSYPLNVATKPIETIKE